MCVDYYKRTYSIPVFTPFPLLLCVSIIMEIYFTIELWHLRLKKITLRKRLFFYIVFHLQFISQKFWILLCLKQGNVKAANCWYYIKIFLITSVTPHHINQLLLAFTGKHKVVCMVICLKGHSKPAYSLVSIWFYQRFISGQSFRRIMTQSRRCLCATVFNTFSFVQFLSFY